MKENYTAAEAELIYFDDIDIITASGNSADNETEELTPHHD